MLSTLKRTIIFPTASHSLVQQMFSNLIEFVFHEGGKVAKEVSNYDMFQVMKISTEKYKIKRNRSTEALCVCVGVCVCVDVNRLEN